MKKIVRLTESDLRRVVKRIIREDSSEAYRILQGIIDSCKNIPAANTNVTYIIDDIVDALEGMGTDEEAVYRALGDIKSMNEFCAVVKQYPNRTGGESFIDAIDGDFDGYEFLKVVRTIQRLQSVTPGGR